jgi:hypothetical protein
LLIKNNLLTTNITKYYLSPSNYLYLQKQCMKILWNKIFFAILIFIFKKTFLTAGFQYFRTLHAFWSLTSAHLSFNKNCKCILQVNISRPQTLFTTIFSVQLYRYESSIPGKTLCYIESWREVQSGKINHHIGVLCSGAMTQYI